MQALLLVSHGSRKEQSNAEVRCLSRKLAEQARPKFAFTQCAFLELATPSIPEGLEECIRRGATEIEVLPYFLATGRHVSEDIPMEIEKKRREHPNVRIRLRNHVGSADDSMVDALLGLVAE